MKKSYRPTYISTATTTTIGNSAMIIHGILVGQTAAGAITVADGGTTIAVLKASIAEGYYELNAVVNGELTVTTAGASKITVLTSKI